MNSKHQEGIADDKNLEEN